MLRALYEQGIAPDLLVGTSAGALNALFVASRPQTVTTANQLGRAWMARRRGGDLPDSAEHSLQWGVAPPRPPRSRSRLRRVLSRHIELEALEHAAIPIHLVTFDVMSGREVLLSEGPALEAILVDGGVAKHTPISHAVDLGADRIYVLPTSAGPGDLEQPHRGAIDAAVHAVSLLLDGRLAADVARYAGEVELIVLPALNRRRVQPTDFGQARVLIEDAFAASRSALTHTPVPVARAA
jgi:NTE family protein